MSFQDPHYERLTELVRISTEMLRSLEKADWHLLKELQSRRAKLVNQLFATNGLPDLAGPVEEMLREIHDLDRNIVNLCKKARNELFQSANQIKLGRQAAQSYEENTTAVV